MEPFDLGIYIRDKRIEKKLTQKQVGEIVGLSRITISGIENGYTMPSIDSMASLALALNIDLNVMYGLKRPKNVVECDGLTEKQTALIKQLVEAFLEQNDEHN